MRNPFRSEADAYRFVWLTLGYFALIVIGSLINVWVGLAVFIVETAVVLWWLVFRGQREAPVPVAPPTHAEGERRILVVANETVVSPQLLDRIRERARQGPASFLLVAPQSDSVASIEADRRLRRALSALRVEGIEAHGQVVDPDPFTAATNAVHDERIDEIIVSTFPQARSGWLRRDLIERLKTETGLPVEHVVAES